MMQQLFVGSSKLNAPAVIRIEIRAYSTQWEFERLGNIYNADVMFTTYYATSLPHEQFLYVKTFICHIKAYSSACQQIVSYKTWPIFSHLHEQKKFTVHIKTAT